MGRVLKPLSGLPFAYRREDGAVRPLPDDRVSPQDIHAGIAAAAAGVQLVGSLVDKGVTTYGQYKAGRAREGLGERIANEERLRQEAIRQQAAADINAGQNAMVGASIQQQEARLDAGAGAYHADPEAEMRRRALGGDRTPGQQYLQNWRQMQARFQADPRFNGPAVGDDGRMAQAGGMPPPQVQPVPIVDERKLSPAARRIFNARDDEKQAMQQQASMLAGMGVQVPGTAGLEALDQNRPEGVDRFPQQTGPGAQPMPQERTQQSAGGTQSPSAMGRRITPAQAMQPAPPQGALPTMERLRARASEVSLTGNRALRQSVLDDFEKYGKDQVPPESMMDVLTGNHVKRAQQELLNSMEPKWKPEPAEPAQESLAKSMLGEQRRETTRRLFEENNPGAPIPEYLLRPGEAPGTIANRGIGSANTAKRTSEADIARARAANAEAAEAARAKGLGARATIQQAQADLAPEQAKATLGKTKAQRDAAAAQASYTDVREAGEKEQQGPKGYRARMVANAEAKTGHYGRFVDKYGPGNYTGRDMTRDIVSDLSRVQAERRKALAAYRAAESAAKGEGVPDAELEAAGIYWKKEDDPKVTALNRKVAAQDAIDGHRQNVADLDDNIDQLITLLPPEAKVAKQPRLGAKGKPESAPNPASAPSAAPAGQPTTQIWK